jgi:hypothetical protein
MVRMHDALGLYKTLLVKVQHLACCVMRLAFVNRW